MNRTAGNILIVDDTTENLKLLVDLLSERGYVVRPAPSGERALAAIDEGLPDLILLDIMMPKMDGYEVCRRLKANEQTQHIPIIFISALDEVFDKVTAFTVGGVDYITKPFQQEEVLARVNTHLTIRQLQHDLQDANETLEEKVKLRTVELAEANESLQVEIEQRKQQQEEKDRLFTVVSQQSEQLRNMTTLLIESQQTDRQGFAVNLQQEIAQKVSRLQTDLEAAQKPLTTGSVERAAEHLANAKQVLTQLEQYVTDVTSDLPQPTVQEKNISESPLIKLTGREREVLQLLAQGKSNNEISTMLSISVPSVYTYNRRIKDKLDLHDVPSLTKFAIEHSLVE